MLNRLRLIWYRLKGKQIADALNSIRIETIGSLRTILVNAGRDSSRLNPDADDDVLLRAHQLLSYCDMFAQHPEYVSRAGFQTALGCIAMSMNGGRQQFVEDAAKMLMDSFPDQAERSVALAARIWGDSLQDDDESGLQVMATALVLLGLQTQQVIALSFKDKAVVSMIQQEKLDIAQGLNIGTR